MHAGHNCLKAELVVTDRSWPLRDKFVAALRRKLSSLPNRVAFYPGTCWNGGSQLESDRWAVHQSVDGTSAV